MRNAGYEISVSYYGEVLGNVAGGVRRGAIYEGWLEVAFDVDLEKALGWRGGHFRTSGYQIHGRGLSANYLGNNLMTASNIEAEQSSRLLDLWLQQDLLDGALQIRAGQFGADNEFTNSAGAANFINSTFGWPAPFAANLPSGGPGLSAGDAGRARQDRAGRALHPHGGGVQR
jgi:porin